MASQNKQKKRQKILLVALAIVIVIVVIWYLVLQKEPSDDTDTLHTDKEEVIKKVELDFSVLDDALFKSLKSHGILPVTSGDTGKVNPFETY